MCQKTKYHGTSNTRIDKCIRPLIKWLNSCDYETVGSCCGHNKYPITVVVKYRKNGVAYYFELFSGVDIPRNRRFYKKDSGGYYYIPETVFNSTSPNGDFSLKEK